MTNANTETLQYFNGWMRKGPSCFSIQYD